MTNAIKEPTENFPKTVMNVIQSVPISDFENEIPSQFLRRGNFARTWGLPSHLSMGDVPCPSSPSHGFLHHIIGTLNIEVRFLLSRFGFAYNLEILFEKIFYFQYKYRQYFLVLKVKRISRQGIKA